MFEAKRGPMRLVGRVAALAVLTLLVGEASLAAPAARDLRWEQLMPADPNGALSKATPRGVVRHGELLGPDRARASFEARVSRGGAPPAETGPKASQPVSLGVVPELSGERVRMRGFVVPIGFDGVRVKEFLLVPYVGACIHVPPPPANQIVFIEAAMPFESNGMFEAVAVTGILRTMTTSTELASVGYHLAAEQVERDTSRR